MVLPFSLYRAQRRRLERIVRKERDALVVQRARILLLVAQLRLVCLVVERVGCARASVYRTLERFERLGEDGLFDARTHRQHAKTPDWLFLLLPEYLSRPPSVWGWSRSTWTLALLREQLRLHHDLLVSKSLLWVVLRRLNYRRLRACPVLRIPVAGRRPWIHRLRRLARSSTDAAPVFFVDEADLDLNPKIGEVWARRAHQPKVRTPGKNQQHYLAGALCAHSGDLVVCDGARKTSALFIELLKRLLLHTPTATPIRLILDNFSIHKSRKVKDFLSANEGRVELHFLPPYSPEENRIEHVWKQLHDHVTRCHRHTSMPALLPAAHHFLLHAQPFPGSGVGLLGLADSGVSGSVEGI